MIRTDMNHFQMRLAQDSKEVYLTEYPPESTNFGAMDDEKEESHGKDYHLSALRQAIITPSRQREFHMDSHNQSEDATPDRCDLSPRHSHPVCDPIPAVYGHQRTNYFPSRKLEPSRSYPGPQSFNRSMYERMPSDYNLSGVDDKAYPGVRSGACVYLCNRDLWLKFHSHTTEMIITKQGRRMFPTLQISLTGLDPHGQYNVFVDMVLVDNKHWKFQNGKWLATGQAEQLPHTGRVYLHPDSPSSGAHWMKQDIVFGKLKLTNNKNCDQSFIVLNSMHKYQPRVHVMELGSQRDQKNLQTHSFQETQFIAVTAYQNTDITQLKIDYNPFAKGFRDSFDRFPTPEDAAMLNPLQGHYLTPPSHHHAVPPVVSSSYDEPRYPSHHFLEHPIAYSNHSHVSHYGNDTYAPGEAFERSPELNGSTHYYMLGSSGHPNSDVSYSSSQSFHLSNKREVKPYSPSLRNQEERSDGSITNSDLQEKNASMASIVVCESNGNAYADLTSWVSARAKSEQDENTHEDTKRRRLESASVKSESPEQLVPESRPKLNYDGSIITN